MQDDRALVPAPWWFELCNALVVNERRGRITEQQTARFLRNVSRASRKITWVMKTTASSSFGSIQNADPVAPPQKYWPSESSRVVLAISTLTPAIIL